MSTNLAEVKQTTDAALPAVTSSIGNMLFEPGVFERVQKMAEIMSKSKGIVPLYLRNNPSDCMAIVMQAAQWRMDPFAVASKTYQVKQGAPIGHEAQLINSVIIINGPFTERPKYKFFGEWGRVQGKLAIKQSDKGKYAVPDWKPSDEDGLGVTVTVHVNGESEPTSMDVLLKQCWPRNSTNWANDPQQQICYAAIRKMARRHFPDVIMGLYTPDELAHGQPVEKDITPTSTIDDLLPAKEERQVSAVDQTLVDISDAATLKELEQVGNRIKTGSKDLQERVRAEYLERKHALTPVLSTKKENVNKDTGEVTTAEPEPGPEQSDAGPTLAEISKTINNAATSAALDVACDVISLLPKKDQAAARKLAQAKRAELEG